MALTSRCAFPDCAFAITLSDDEITIKIANRLMNKHWESKHPEKDQQERIEKLTDGFNSQYFMLNKRFQRNLNEWL